MDLTDHFISPAPSLVRSVPKIIFLQRQHLGAKCGDAAFHQAEPIVREIAPGGSPFDKSLSAVSENINAKSYETIQEGSTNNLSDTEVVLTAPAVYPASGSQGLAILAARAAYGKKARDPKVMDLGDLLGITDYFVVCSASNDRQIKTIVAEVERSLKEVAGIKPRGIEGLGDASWVLMDYGEIVVHVMSEEARAFYAIERLWSDAQLIDWVDVA